MSAVAPTRVLVRCDGADVPAWLAERGWPRRVAVSSRGAHSEINLRIEDLAGLLGANVSPRSADLLRIAAYASRADQLVSRGGDRDAHAAKWRRHLALCVPVADPDYWGAPDVTDRLAAALNVFTDDRWEFAFSPEEPGTRQLHLESGARRQLGDPGSVVLFSGGADSLGVLVAAADRGERPVPVGHWSAPPHIHRQRRLLGLLDGRFSGWRFRPIGFKIHRHGAEPAERTHRTRAFLFATLGAVVAAESAVETVYLGDNGPVSLNLPISAQLVGTLASRSTHPKALAAVNRLLDGMFPGPIRVENPLWAQTRTEGLEDLKAAGCADLLRVTLSCSRWSRLPGATPQCGTCSQCVDRRFAAIAAGLDDHDPAGHYKRDVFLSDLPPGEDRTTAEAYVRFAQGVHASGDDDLLVAYPQLLDAVLADDPDPEGTLRVLVDLLRRHAATAITVLETMTARHLGPLAAGTLPPTCLLRLVHGPPTPTTVNVEPTIAPDLPTHVADAPAAGAQVPANGSRNEVLPEPVRLPEPEVTANVFAFDGQVWQLTYRGVTRQLAHGEGLTLIACLLRQPRREFTGAELVAVAYPSADAPVDEGFAMDEGLWAPGYASGGTQIDDKTDTFVEEYLAVLQQEAERAQATGRPERAIELAEEIADARRHLQAAKGLLGEPRPFPDNTRRAHDSASRLIRRTQPKIAEVHPPLGEHLENTIRRTPTFVYRPEGDVRWRIRLPIP